MNSKFDFYLLRFCSQEKSIDIVKSKEKWFGNEFDERIRVIDGLKFDAQENSNLSQNEKIEFNNYLSMAIKILERSQSNTKIMHTYNNVRGTLCKTSAKKSKKKQIFDDEEFQLNSAFKYK